MTAIVGAIGGVVGGIARVSAGVTGGIVGGVAHGVIGVAGGVVGAVGSAASYALGDDSDEEQDPSDENAPNIYEQRTRVDQILYFFEREHEHYAGYFKDAEELERLRVEYYNCINAIEFQNELIAQLVDEVLDLRLQLRCGKLDSPPTGGPGSLAAIRAQGAARKELGVKLAHAKLDIGERKTKRMFKEKDRRALVGTLSPLLSDVKLQRLLEEQASAQREAEDVPSFQSAASKSRSLDRVPVVEAEVVGSACEANVTSSTMSRRRYKQYSDAELTALLRQKDD